MSGGEKVIDGKVLGTREGWDLKGRFVDVRWMEETRARAWKALLINRRFVDFPSSCLLLDLTEARAERDKRLT